MTDLKYCIDDLDTVIEQTIKPFLRKKTILLLKGPLGAGKTTLVRNLLHAYGVKGPVVSPTFSYVQTYENNHGEVFHHFDLYRIEDIHTFFALGLDELLRESGSKSFIEWPEIITDWLASSSLMMSAETATLAYDSEDKRQRLLEIVGC